MLGILLVAVLLWRRRGGALLLLLACAATTLYPDAAWAAHPRSVLAQWSWLADLDRLQVVLAAALWLAALGFFFAVCRSAGAPGRR